MTKGFVKMTKPFVYCWRITSRGPRVPTRETARQEDGMDRKPTNAELEILRVHGIGGGFDVSLGLRHRARSYSASDWSWGGELGYLLMRDVWLVGGYNAVGFADIDLPTNVHSGSAGYLSFRFKFDERLLR